jgi:hypothetical protein
MMSFVAHGCIPLLLGCGDGSGGAMCDIGTVNPPQLQAEEDMYQDCIPEEVHKEKKFADYQNQLNIMKDLMRSKERSE